MVTETFAHDMIYTECGRFQYKEIWVENESNWDSRQLSLIVILEGFNAAVIQVQDSFTIIFFLNNWITGVFWCDVSLFSY